ncbi:MAG TPA: glycoside hydrolase family 44 protein [Polyangiaceae bacterium]|nr:glycoside hydrolase family 44 protein [Polyangiaceae bacterium]
MHATVILVGTGFEGDQFMNTICRCLATLLAVVSAVACSSDSGSNATGDGGAAGTSASGGGAGGGGAGNPGARGNPSGKSGGGGTSTAAGGTANGSGGTVSSNGGSAASSGGATGGNGGVASGGGAGAAGAAGQGSGMVVSPGDPGAHDVLFTIDTTANQHPISPYVYGTNQGNLQAEGKGITLTRVGGNRLTAYNWETNASNAGKDANFSSDNFISKSSVAGDPMKQAAKAASDAGASIIMTVPTAGWVSADESGSVDSHPASTSVIQQHFFPIIAKKGSAFAYPPDTTDSKVYADEFVAWMESQFPNAQTDAARRIFYMLDNEPDLWSSTHSEIHPNPATYAEMVQRSTDYASAIKAAAPKTLVFAPANYGWQGYLNLQSAPDANNRDFLEFYLDSMKAAEQTAGKRLVDVLDVHWYPEATGDGKRITDDGTGSGELTARLQAPRSLWDTSYTETSWITQTLNAPIQLIPRLLKKIADHYPGTKLSISEYNYGAGGDISGGIAQADVLGIFGREGMFAANMWELSGTNTFIFAAFSMYRNYDGNGATFGDTSVSAITSAADASSVYASVASGSGANVVVVAINKQGSTQKAGITLKHTASLAGADVYALTSGNAKPVKGSALTKVATNAFNYTMPGNSVTTLVFHP